MSDPKNVTNEAANDDTDNGPLTIEKVLEKKLIKAGNTPPPTKNVPSTGRPKE